MKPKKLKIAGQITLTKKARISLLKSPLIKFELAKISEKRLVSEPIKTSRFMIVLLFPINKLKSGISEENVSGLNNNTISVKRSKKKSTSAE